MESKTESITQPQSQGPADQQDNGKPRNVSARLWEKFKALEKRTNEVTQRSTEKRIKHLQKEVLNTVLGEFKSPEEQAMLERHQVKLSIPISADKISRKRKADQDLSSLPDEGTSSPNSIQQLNEYMHVNDHLQLTNHSRPPMPTALEQRMEAAVRQGDINTAEALSDHLATRQIGEKIISAIDAKRFVEAKKKEEESAKLKRKKNLHWGFEAKQRWETKGNM